MEDSMNGPKIVVIGAGSFFFGRPVIWNMTQNDILRNGTLALVDTDRKVLDTMMALGKRTIEATGAPTQLIGSTDRREVLRDADFVVLTFSHHNAYYRGLDCEIALKHGIRMCSGDTIGPGGIFRAVREVPKALEMARDVAELAPHAWLINFVNPTSVLGIALMRYAPEVRSFAICDGLHEPYYRLNCLKYVGLLPDDAKEIPPQMRKTLDIRVHGVNHFTFLTHFFLDGKDLLPKWREVLAEKAKTEQTTTDAQLADNLTPNDSNAAAKSRFNHTYSLKLMDLFQAFPNRISHTKEYVPYFQGYGAADTAPTPITIFNAEIRNQIMTERWQETERYARGEQSIDGFISGGTGDHATDIIASMWGGLGRSFYVNTPNRGAVPNMNDDAYLELLSSIDMDGPVPHPIGNMPTGLLGLQQQVLDTHELTAKAAAECDRQALLAAMAVDPIVNNLADAENIIAETLDRQREGLAEGWTS